MKRFYFVIFFLSIVFGTSHAKRIEVYFFYSKNCEHCQEIREKVFPKIKKDYSANLVIREFEIEENRENYQKLVEMERAYKDENNEIPVTFIGSRVIAGDEFNKEFLPYLRELLSRETGEDTSALVPAETTTIVEEVERVVSEKYPVFMAFFWEPGCQHCQRVFYDIDLLKKRHPTLVVRDWNIDEKSSKLIAEALAHRLDVPEELRLATPSVFLVDTAFITSHISFRAMDEAISRLENIEDLDTIWKIAPEELAEANERIISRFRSFSLTPVIAAGLIDGVNPCAFGALIFFITFMTIIERKRREIVAVGLAFTISVFLTYLLIGFGLLRFLQVLPFIKIIARWVYLGTGVLVIALGVLSLVDFIRSLKGDLASMTLQLPDRLKKRIQKVIISENEPSAQRNIMFASAVTGFFVSVLELACTGQIYLPTIVYVMGAPGMKIKAFFYLFLYNFMFIVPLIVVFAVVFFGTTSEQLTRFLRKNTPIIKILTALLFFVMAYYLWKTVVI